MKISESKDRTRKKIYKSLTLNVIFGQTKYVSLVNILLLFLYFLGYFLHDLMDLSLNYRNRSSYELIIHHCFVIVCFGLSIMTTFYIG